MIWSYFIIFAVVSVVLWAIGAWAAWRNRRIFAFGATGLGLVIFFSYILIMWIIIGTSTTSHDGRNAFMV